MMYFKPKRKGCKVNFGRRREVTIPMNNIVEINEIENKACIKAITGAVMIYYGGGVMNMENRDIARLVANDNFIMTTSFKFAEVK